MRCGLVYRVTVIFLILGSLSLAALPGHDPMQPANIIQAAKESVKILDSSYWHLNLIRQTGAERLALLNGQLVTVGGRIEGAVVTAISHDQVTLRLPDDRLIKLELPSVRLRNAAN